MAAQAGFRSPVARKVLRRLKMGYLAKNRQPQGQPPMVAGMPYPYYMYPPGQLPATEEKQEEEKVKGISISGPTVQSDFIPFGFEKKKNLSDVRITYPLIPRAPAQGERVFASADIRWNKKLSELIYYIVEPQLTNADLQIIEKTKKELEERLDIDFFKLGQIEAKDLLMKETDRILGRNPDIGYEKIDDLKYYIERDIIGMGKIESIMNDPNIEDVSCDGVNIPLYVYHRNPSLGSFTSVMRMAESAWLISLVSRSFFMDIFL